MAPLNDPNQLSKIREALSERTVEGFVQFRPLAMAWLRRNLDGHTSMSVATLMNEHVESGGEIDRVIERREDHRDRHEFHFDFRLQIDDQRVYIETTLTSTKTGPILTVVNMHHE